MSLIPPGTTAYADISLYASVQVAATSAALYDHALSLSREVELIWMKPLSLVTVLYVIERYLGDIVLVAGLFLCFSPTRSEEASIQLFQFRAWGALVYSWATQATMQLRLYAMYRRSKRVLAILITFFFCEVASIAFIIWQTIGPTSTLQALNDEASAERYCAFYGINGDFVYIFIPFLCFELFLLFLAARVFIGNLKRNREADEGKGRRVDSFMHVLARDSLSYFFVNLIACAVVMGLWQSVTQRYANLCIPFVMLLEVLVGTKLILDFRERYSRSDDPVVSGRYSSMRFEEDDRLESIQMPVRCQVETVVVTDGGTSISA